MPIDVEELYKKYGPMVIRRCKRILKDEQQALQAMHDVFVKVLLNQKRLNDKYPSALLYKIATNVCINILRDKKLNFYKNSEELIDNLSVKSNIEDQLISQNLVQTIFSKEKESTRTIAYLFYVDRLPWQEIAQIAGMSVSGVRKRIKLFKEKVKKQKEVLYGN